MKLKYSYIINVFFIGLLSSIIMDVFLNSYFYLTGHPLNTLAPVGRYFLYTLSGHFITEPIGMVPQMKYEILAGQIIHFGLGILYAFIYLAFVQKKLYKKAKISITLLYSWALMVMPMVIQSKLFGDGFFHSNNPHMLKALLMTLFVHTSFGIGIFVATNILYFGQQEQELSH